MAKAGGGGGGRSGRGRGRGGGGGSMMSRAFGRAGRSFMRRTVWRIPGASTMYRTGQLGARGARWYGRRVSTYNSSNRGRS